MSIRLVFGILALAALASSSSASVLDYRATGAFEDSMGSVGTEPFVVDFSFDPSIPNGTNDPTFGDAPLAGMSWRIGSGSLVTADFGTISVSNTADPANDWIEVSGQRTNADGSAAAFLLHFGDLDLPSLATPTDLLTAIQGGTRAATYVAFDPNGFLSGLGSGNVKGVQAVPEPAALGTLAVGALGLLRRRRA